jgi:large subunit ribosomal protein L24
MPGVDIKKDDNVRVMSGKDRGHTGRVIHVLPDRGKVMVEGAARAKKHQRATGKRSTSGAQLQQGGIIDTELYIDISNVQLVCRSCGQPTRVGHRTDVDGKKVRICRKCEAEL